MNNIIEEVVLKYLRYRLDEELRLKLINNKKMGIR